jgi:hypothetical protein
MGQRYARGEEHVGGEGWVARWKSRSCDGGVVGRDMLDNLLSLLLALLDTFTALTCHNDYGII